MTFTCLDVARTFGLSGEKRSSKEIRFRCPHHDDQHPSLSINLQKNCWLCGPCGAGGNGWELVAFINGFDPGDKEAIARWLGDHGLSHKADGDVLRKRIVATYPYRDEDSKVLFEVVRYEPKSFRQRRPDGRGGYIWSLNGSRLVPYHVPEIAGKQTVVVTEGEKDADALWEWGIPATCNPMGAGKWKAEFNQFFCGKKVAIIPDADASGERHARDVALNLLSVADKVKIVRLLAKDYSEWKAKGGTRDQFLQLVKQTPFLTAADLEKVTPSARGLQFISLRELLNEPDEQFRWVVQDRLICGGLSLLAGKPKAGKSTLARYLALCVGRGADWLGFPTTGGSVFYLALEEKRSEVKRHFKTMGAIPDDPIQLFIAPSPEDGLQQLREAASKEHPALIIVDPLLKMIRVRDSNDYAVVTAALDPLLTLARDTGAHVLAVHHLGKGERFGGDAILGSTAIFAAVDTALLMKRSDKYRTISSIQRYGEDLEEVTLTWNPEAMTIDAGASRKEADEIAAADSILEYLQGEPADERAISEAVAGRKEIKVRALRRLVSEQKVNRTGEGKKGVPFLYSISGFLVPTYIREPENQNPKIALTDSKQMTNSSSHGNSEVEGDSKSREQEFSGSERVPGEPEIDPQKGYPKSWEL